MNQFTLLPAGKVFGLNQIDVIKKLGTKCAVSDFAILLGASTPPRTYYVDDNAARKARTGSWYSLSSTSDGYIRAINIGGSMYNEFSFSRNCAIRPVLPYSNISDISQNVERGKNGLLEVEYGEYPQYVVDVELGKKLDKEYNAGRLTKTGKRYTTDCIKIDEYDREFQPTHHEEFEYKGKKYVMVKCRARKSSCTLSNGDTIEPGTYVWIEVSPIKWYVDEESKLLVSKTLLASGIRFCGKKKYKGNFKKTEMYMFLNKYFAKDIIPSKTDTLEEKEVDNKTSESKAEKLIREIYSYLEDMPNADEVIERLDIIVKNYNEKLKKLSENKRNNVPSVESLSSITSDLELKLSMLLDNLRKHHDKFRAYFNMIDTIDEYIAVVNGSGQENNSELASDLNTIMNVCIPFLKEEDGNRIKMELLAILNNQKQEIIKYLHSNNIFNNNMSGNKLGYTTVEEMDLELRKKLHPILENLSISVNKRDIELEIRESMKKIIEGIYEEPKNKFLSFFLTKINDTYTKICLLLVSLPVDLQKKYNQELTDIMDDKIDYNKNLKFITDDLRTIWSSLNKLLCKVKNYINELDKIEDSQIDLSRFKR